MTGVSKSSAARADLVAHYVYLAEEASEAVAERFLANAETSFASLVEQPKMGAPLNLQSPALANLRKWRVKDFERVLIVYQPRQHDILIVRVLHTSQDWWSLLDQVD